MDKVLVTGGCGYIGSHTVVELIENGYHVISVDNFSNSDASVLDRIERITGITVKNYAIDLCDQVAVESIFREHGDFAGIIHFAAFKAVGESVKLPFRYFRNNVGSAINVADCAVRYRVPCFVYSSSCTVYGIPDRLPVTESTPVKEAESPYGRTKQIGEWIVRDGFKGTGLQAISLRYFNPAGAHPSSELGEDPVNVALNLVPVITETAYGLREQMEVYGNDYDTRDGTCVRDYIHVMDLARAHSLALKTALNQELSKPMEVVNLGIGEGVTVLEAINAFERETGVKLNYRISGRRPGDVPAIYADYNKARQLFGWEPEYGIGDIMRTAWAWEVKRRTTEIS